jgi:energy-coupling factor transporter ATP-binding protein EcfA2
MPVTAGGERVHDLTDSVRAVRAAVAELSYPLPMPSAVAARTDRAALLAQLDDYVLPRLVNPDAPLLVVVGGSTGAGKSTLVNSLAQARVSRAGVLRPTTRTPVLACHPADLTWFRGGAALASSARGVVSLIAATALPTGLAFLDIPDFDAANDTDQALADRLLAAADLWLFVTTAARYADAVPWELLGAARARGVVIALVLDRVPPQSARVADGGASAVVTHLTELLAAGGPGLAGAPVFVLPEARVDGQGLLPDEVIAPLRSWFGALCADQAARGAVARCTLDGTLAAIPPRVEALAAAAEEQVSMAEALAEQVGMAYGAARSALEQSLPAAGTGDRAGGRGSGGGAESDGSLVALVRGAAADAAEQTGTAWRGYPGGEALLAPASTVAGPGLAGKVERVVRTWSGGDRETLLHRVGELLDAEAARWLDGLAAVPPDGSSARRARRAGGALAAARSAARLSAGPPVVPVPRPQPSRPLGGMTR